MNVLWSTSQWCQKNGQSQRASFCFYGAMWSCHIQMFVWFLWCICSERCSNINFTLWGRVDSVNIVDNLCFCLRSHVSPLWHRWKWVFGQLGKYFPSKWLTFILVKCRMYTGIKTHFVVNVNHTDGHKLQWLEEAFPISCSYSQYQLIRKPCHNFLKRIVMKLLFKKI